jgi:hypothetical protein
LKGGSSVQTTERAAKQSTRVGLEDLKTDEVQYGKGGGRCAEQREERPRDEMLREI